MNVASYAVETAIEADHWWFAGRRLLFSDIIRRFGFSRNIEILDVGTGTGSNLRLLRELGFTRVTGVDQSREAIRWCADKGLGEVRLGDVCTLPFPDGQFDLILATDVIEHVEDDLQALRRSQAAPDTVADSSRFSAALGVAGRGESSQTPLPDRSAIGEVAYRQAVAATAFLFQLYPISADPDLPTPDTHSQHSGRERGPDQY